MSEKNDGGRVFPMPFVRYERDGYSEIMSAEQAGFDGGLTLRDYFAAQALVGYCACVATSGKGLDPILAADRAYKLADAMLAEREK